jgi:purine-binding chemotaxis protein CheW
VDHFNGILRVPAAQCHPVPPLLARGRAADVQSICRLDGGARLVCVLSPEHVLQAGADGQAPQPLAREASGRHEARLAGRRTAGDRPVRFIVYRVGHARFAAAMPSIDEVLRAGAGLTPVPGGPPAVAGMMHHRGAALPVIDLRRQFGLPGGAAGKAKILVHAVRGSSGEAAAAGFMVDAVEGVVAAASGGIAVPPALPAASAALVTHILDSPDGTAPLPVLDLRRLLDGAAGSLPALLEGLLPSPAAQAEARAMLH